MNVKTLAKYTLLGTVATSLLVATPAQATIVRSFPSVSVNASPEPVTAGKSVKVAGRVGASSSRSNGRVNYYFKGYKSTTWSYKGYSYSSASGYYSKYLTQSTSGYWRARFLGNTYRKPNYSGTDYVEAKAYRNVARTVFYRSGYGDYTGPTLSLPNLGAMRVGVSLSCASSFAPFVVVSWNGNNYDFQYTWFDPASGVGSTTTYWYPTDRTGHFELATQSDCTYTVKITQTVRVYTKV